ncbi:PaaI family thioesterase [Marinivivus vitaminiproducens]|uniref:PaaI family thioesterase n=1 Tax=Marinivivus vitaminiproducens TaxID=3035935 RepID=UPI0027A4AF99|nr:PaaI family thioesterase [Geminicoccaceae bacterium SCSIO 64248]
MTDDLPPFHPALHGWQRVDDTGFIAMVGPLWHRIEDGALVMGFVAEDKHHNRRGVVQGGMIMTFADRALGAGTRHVSGGAPVATVQLDVHFVDATRIGAFVTTRPRVIRQTSSLFFMEGDLVAAGGIVASARGIWKRVRPD